MTNLPADQRCLAQTLIESAADRAKAILSAPASAVELRKLGPNGLNEIQRLEHSPLAEDQILAVGLRLAGSRALRGDVACLLAAYFANPASSLEIEAHRRTIWKMNRINQPPIDLAEEAMARLMQSTLCEKDNTVGALPHWAALYADLWCDPRIGADAQVRRIMLAMVSLLHERSLAVACRKSAHHESGMSRTPRDSASVSTWPLGQAGVVALFLVDRGRSRAAKSCGPFALYECRNLGAQREIRPERRRRTQCCFQLL